jgi:hypothetical protein
VNVTGSELGGGPVRGAAPSPPASGVEAPPEDAPDEPPEDAPPDEAAGLPLGSAAGDGPLLEHAAKRSATTTAAPNASNA